MCVCWTLFALAGGGGYNIRNVSRCWTYETAVCLDSTVSNDIPYNDFFQYYGPNFKLHLQPADMSNRNAKEDLEKTKVQVLQNLKELEFAPSVQMQQVPPDLFLMDDPNEPNPDVRISRTFYLCVVLLLLLSGFVDSWCELTASFVVDVCRKRGRQDGTQRCKLSFHFDVSSTTWLVCVCLVQNEMFADEKDHDKDSSGTLGVKDKMGTVHFQKGSTL